MSRVPRTGPLSLAAHQACIDTYSGPKTLRRFPAEADAFGAVLESVAPRRAPPTPNEAA